jgi:hypothetical protein
LAFEARGGDDYHNYETARAGADRRQRWGLAATVVSTAFVVAGLGRYLHLAIEDRGASLGFGVSY